jgi:hypothetical protein
MRMVLEQLGGRFVRFSLHDHEATHLVADVLDAVFSDLLRLAEWPAHDGNRRVGHCHVNLRQTARRQIEDVD